MLRKAIHTLPERYQKVVLLDYTKELTMRTIGALLGVNESRVSEVHKLALEKMALVLHHNGINSIHQLFMTGIFRENTLNSSTLAAESNPCVNVVSEHLLVKNTTACLPSQHSLRALRRCTARTGGASF
jgi:sigma-70-like protein